MTSEVGPKSTALLSDASADEIKSRQDEDVGVSLEMALVRFIRSRY